MSALEGASRYLNNLLLARGLLSDGKPIDFAHPAHNGESTDATMSKVINLVHDLVLRRDREGEQREKMAASIRSLRTAEHQHILDSRQLQDKNEQLRNDLTSTQTHERAVQSTLKKMDQHVKELKEQNLKMKSMLDQVRAKCVSDVRKRDVEIEKLKSHLISLQRGKKDAGGMKINSISLRPSHNKLHQTNQDVNSAEWSLEKETNEFLAEVVNETSAENVSLRRVVYDTLEMLKEMTGQSDRELQESFVHDDGIGIPGQYRESRQQEAKTIVPVDSLAEQMNIVLDLCRTLLKDPSFVPIEEVQIREEEIVKLRAGWEKMADRWKDIVMMMGQWKQRMMLEGKDTDVEEFSDLSFGRSIAVRPDGQPVLGHEAELSMIFEESVANETTPSLDREPGTEETESDLELEPEPCLKRLISSPARRGVKLLQPTLPLAETNGNSTHSTAVSKRSPNFSNEKVGSDTENMPSVTRSKNLTVSEKLAAVAAEAADAAEGRGGALNRKRKVQSGKVSGRNRRRSTLNPEELANLMGLRQ